jgi:hypothetical protein
MNEHKKDHIEWADYSDQFERRELAEASIKELKSNNIETSKEYIQTLKELGQVKAKLELLEAKEAIIAVGKCPECILKDRSINELEAELRKDIAYLVDVADGLTCEDLHHKKQKRHDYNEDCPVLSELQEVIEKYQ